jgi:hypothetical protein
MVLRPIVIVRGLVEAVEPQDLGVFAVYLGINLYTQALVVHYLCAIAHRKFY